MTVMNPHPLVTIIIPMRNEAAYIERCLGAMLAQDYLPDRMEVIVADGMSNDGTRKVLKEFSPSGELAGPMLRIYELP